jgi:hypothetical protein
MQRYTILFIIVNALPVSGSFSSHHQELKNCTHSIWYVPGLLATTTSVVELELVCQIDACLSSSFTSAIFWLIRYYKKPVTVNDDKQTKDGPTWANRLNPLNVEFNPACHLLALLGAHHILHVSGIRVKGTGCSVVANWNWQNNHEHRNPCFIIANRRTYLLVLESTKMYLKVTLKCSYMFRSVTIIRELVIEPS